MKIKLIYASVSAAEAKVEYLNVDSGRYEYIVLPLPPEPLTLEGFAKAIQAHHDILELSVSRFQWLIDHAYQELDIDV